jgi:hypothetical protein
MSTPIDLSLRAAGLWYRGASLGVRAALLPLKVSAHVAEAACEQLRGRTATAEPLQAAPSPEPVAVAVAEPEAPPAPKPAARRAKPRRSADPTKAQVARERRARAAAEEQAAQETDALPPAGAEIVVAEPWDGYAQLSAAEVVDRLADADPTTRAAVRLYELAHESREAVLHVTER